MTTSSGLRASDGQSIQQTLTAMTARLGTLSDESVKAIGAQARRVVAEEGAYFYIRARRTRKPVRLGAKLSASTANRPVVEGVPSGFWTIVNRGSDRTWRIERRLLGRGRNRRAQLLRTPYGPRPYVIRHGQRPVGHPWEKAVRRVERIPQKVIDPAVVAVFKDLWKG